MDAILTDRQLDVYRLLRRGLTYQQIGEQLEISRRTVEYHAGALRRKTGAVNNVAAVARVRARGLAPRDDD